MKKELLSLQSSGAHFVLIVYLFSFLIWPTSGYALEEVYVEDDSLSQVLLGQIEATDSIETEIRLLQELGLHYMEIAPDKVEFVAADILDISKRADYSKGVATGYNLLGLFEEQKGNYPTAVEHYLKTIDHFEQERDFRSAAYVQRNLAGCYQYLGENEKAIEALEKSLSIFVEIKDTTGQAYAYNILGNVYGEMGNGPKAVDCHSKCYEFATYLSDHNLMAISSLNVANNMDYIADYNEVMVRLSNALQAFKAMGNLKGEAIAYNNFGSVELENKKNGSAINYLNKSIKLAKEITFNPLLLDDYGLMKEAYANSGDYKKAYEYANLHNTLSTTLLNEQTSGRISELEVLYETEKKDRQLIAQERDIALLEKDKKYGRLRLYTFAGLTVLFGLVASAVFLIYRQRKKLEAIRRNQQIHDQINEINFLRKKIDRQINNRRAVSKRKIDNAINDLLDNPLSERELEVLNELSKGKTNKEIAESLNVSVNTVKTHLMNVYVKLDVSNRTKAVQKLTDLLDK